LHKRPPPTIKTTYCDWQNSTHFDNSSPKYVVGKESIQYTPGLHEFSKNLGATSKFYVPEARHKASSVLRMHKYYASLHKIQSLQ